MKKFLIALSLLIAAAPASAEWAIEVRDAWIRHIPGDRPMAGYMVLGNKGNTERRLVGASSVVFGAVHMHETVEQDGTSRMRPVEHVAVPAGGSVAFEPGGRHLMLMQRQRELAVGDEVPVTLEFEDGGSQSVVFTVKPAWQE